jgi:60 kDa SS-A/Ro ribonucleoprotein
MANKNLFNSLRGWLAPATDALNEEGAAAYRFSPEAELAQYAATGCLNSTFHASAQDQLAKVLDLSNRVGSEFIELTAIYCRERAHNRETQ